MASVIGAALPTLTQIATWDTTHLRAAGQAWSVIADGWEEHFTSAQAASQAPGGSVWEGQAAEAAQNRTYDDLVKVRQLTDGLHGAAAVARRGADQLAEVKREVLDAVQHAEASGFTVGEDLSVTGRQQGGSLAEQGQRRAKAAEHAATIKARAAKLSELDRDVSGRVSAATADLNNVTFTESPTGSADGRESTIQAVDFSTAPLPLEPPPKDPGLPQPPGGWSDDPAMEDAQRIAYGHAWSKHLADWKGMTQDQLAEVVHDMMTGDPRADPGLNVAAIPGRSSTAIYKDGIVVIHDPLTGDGGTVYRPTNGFDEFLRLVGGAGGASLIADPPQIPPALHHPALDPLPLQSPHAPTSLPPAGIFDPAGLPPWLANSSAPPTPVSLQGPLIFPNTPLESPPIAVSPDTSGLSPHIDFSPGPNIADDLATAGQANAPAVAAGGLSIAALLALLMLSPG